MTTIDPRELTRYTAGVRRAVRAYAADQAVAAGFCAICKYRHPHKAKDGFPRRICPGCKREGRTEIGALVA